MHKTSQSELTWYTHPNSWSLHLLRFLSPPSSTREAPVGHTTKPQAQTPSPSEVTQPDLWLGALLSLRYLLFENNDQYNSAADLDRSCSAL